MAFGQIGNAISLTGIQLRVAWKGCAAAFTASTIVLNCIQVFVPDVHVLKAPMVRWVMASKNGLAPIGGLVPPARHAKQARPLLPSAPLPPSLPLSFSFPPPSPSACYRGRVRTSGAVWVVWQRERRWWRRWSTMITCPRPWLSPSLTT